MSDPVHPDSVHPDSVHPDSVHPDSVHPDSVHPDSDHPDSDHPGPDGPRPDRRGRRGPDHGSDHSSQPASAAPRPLRTLPPRPDLRRLRDEAKKRRRDGEFAQLAEAQLAVAREHGFASWPRLKTYVETRALDLDQRAAMLVRSACSSDIRTARTLLDAEPELARHDLAAACVTGEVDEVRRRLDRDPGAATRRTAPSDWPPLTYACFSRFLRTDSRRTDSRRTDSRHADSRHADSRHADSGHADPDRAARIVAVARLLLDAGADPDAGYTDDHGHLQVPLYAATGIANNAELTAMLLDAGADPDENGGNEAVYHAAEFTDITCARLLLDAGPDPEKVSYCLGRALDFDNLAMVELFLTHGADPNHGSGAHLRKALRNGRMDQVDLLLAHGADETLVSDDDRAVAALLSGERAPEAGVQPHPDVLRNAAQANNVSLLRQLLAAGAHVDAAPDGVMTALQRAAWCGQADAVELLLAAGADPAAVDSTYHSNSVQMACHGSENCHDPHGGPSMRTVEEVRHGDYPRTVELLLDAGAPVPEQALGSDAVRAVLVARGAAAD
ncbi:ankyrin repeat domain-containing protein [Actinopolymorpha sp. B11F2]|uniref:ankyrin repeat domain-containing protein n=1 Tax=Actinopolymorpha sp. B11F2 TaxID=3160862 RepID=UPI0032E4530D